MQALGRVGLIPVLGSEENMKIQISSIFALLVLVPLTLHAADVHVRANSSIPSGSVSGYAAPNDYDVPPRLIKGDAPIYPISQRLANKTGHATIEFTIGSDGKTGDFTVVESDVAFYASHAIVAVQKWRFEPAKKDGKPNSIRVRQRFEYASR
jgi:TonB family protein